MRVAASSPAWLTRRAESRNCCWVGVRGLLRFGFGIEGWREEGEGSEPAAAEGVAFCVREVVLKVLRAASWKARGLRGRRVARIGRAMLESYGFQQTQNDRI